MGRPLSPVDGASPVTAAARPPTSGAEERRTLLEARVSTIIDAHEDALPALITHGFTLLAQAPLRWAMAHTVNLGQAFRLRGLSSEEQDGLLDALAELGVPARLERGASGHGPNGSEG